jgi:hypothetical protein
MALLAGLSGFGSSRSAKTRQGAKALCDARIADARSALHNTLYSFKNLGAALLEAKGDEASLDAATETGIAKLFSSGRMQADDAERIALAGDLTNQRRAINRIGDRAIDDTLNAHFGQRWHTFKRAL